MKLHSGLDARHLMQMLGETLHKEQEQWKPILYKTTTGLEISAKQRDEMATWLVFLSGKFHFMPETCNLAISLLDRILLLVKVRPKYLQCVAVSCFYIAAKTLEEDEMIPCTVDLVRVSQCGCSVSEVLRMEAIILNKLNWNLRTSTAVDFLHIIHSVLMWHHPYLLDGLSDVTPSRHMTILIRKLFSCLCHHDLLMFRPVTLVLAILSLDLQQITKSWLPLVVVLQSMTRVENEHLIGCRELVAGHLGKRQQLLSGYAFRSAQQKSKKRKVEQTDADEIYDSIKRLYNEDGNVFEKPSAVRGTCGSEMHLEPDGDLYPPVQTVCAT